MKIKMIVFAAYCLFTMIQTSAQQTDSRISRQLNNMNLKFDTTTSGDFKLLFELNDKRTQMVFVNSVTKMFEDAEVREISSPALFITNADQLGKDQLWSLLAFNSQSVLGAWQLQQASNGWGLHFTVKVPAQMPDNRLMMYMVLVAKVADEMEKTLSQEDVF
jgi:hypothetical protein